MDVMESVGAISQEARDARKKAVAEEYVIPRGFYEGLVYTYNIQEPGEFTPPELIGKTVFSVGLRLDVDGKTRSTFVKMTPDELFKDDGKTPVAKYGAAIDLAEVMGLDVHVPFNEVLEQAKVVRARYNIQVWYKKDSNGNTDKNNPGGNWIKGVSAPRS